MLWIIVHHKKSVPRVTEVRYKSFFSLSGYGSALHCTTLGVRVHKPLAMLTLIINSMSLTRMGCKEVLDEVQEWIMGKKQHIMKALKCWNLEHVLNAEVLGKNMDDELIMDF